MYKWISKESAEFDSLLKQPEVSALLSKKAVLKLNIQSNMLQMKLKTANSAQKLFQSWFSTDSAATGENFRNLQCASIFLYQYSTEMLSFDWPWDIISLENKQNSQGMV